MEGSTYFVYNPHIPCVIRLTGDGENDIVVGCKNDICLALIPNDLIPLALSKQCGCCGDVRICFRQATQEEIDRFNS